MFVLPVSDAVLVVYLSWVSFLLEVPPPLIFIMPFPGVDGSYNFHLALL